MLSKEEVLRIIAHCKDSGLSYKDGCVELGIKVWRFHEAKAHYKRLETEGASTGEFLQLRADGPMERASITAFEGPARERKSRKEEATSVTRLQVEIIGRSGGTMRLYGDFTAETLSSLVKTLQPMFSLNEDHRYWLWSQPTDMRKNFYSLAAIVANGMKRDASDGDVYVFINRSRTRIKMLHWEPGGLVLYSKLLEAGTLGKPSVIGEDGSLQWRDLVLMVEGIIEQPDSRRQRLEHLKKLRK